MNTNLTTTRSSARRSARSKLVASLAALTAISVGFPSMPTASAETIQRTAVIDQNVLIVNDAQEEGWFSDGDEPYIAVIGYRGTLGVPGSTVTRYLGGLRELSSGAYDGKVLGIPDSMGREQFTKPVVRRSLADIRAGRTPDIVGTVTLVMESDATPWSTMNSIMKRANTELRRQLDPIIGTASVMTSAADLTKRLEAVAPAVKKAALGSTWNKVGAFLSSFGDPDDLIGIGVTGFVAVDDTLGASVERRLSAIPSKVGTFGQLTFRPFVQRFARDGATYTIIGSVTI